ALRRAYFNATLCLAHPDGRDVLYVGRCDGTLVWPPRGDQGHGYDPMFMPDGHDTTFGEMAAAVKHSWSPGENGLSHRARAFAQFVENQINHGRASCRERVESWVGAVALEAGRTGGAA